ncbi:hypothetical protein BaRGS_00000370 [Batillaria attramentaria]|uniref:Uncharacterized protein n=1 Tax=Batillaria attramentaria TaxID=370345 RepID=A0ABD0M9T3_9CAEN
MVASVACLRSADDDSQGRVPVSYVLKMLRASQRSLSVTASARSVVVFCEAKHETCCNAVPVLKSQLFLRLPSEVSWKQQNKKLARKGVAKIVRVGDRLPRQGARYRPPPHGLHVMLRGSVY